MVACAPKAIKSARRARPASITQGAVLHAMLTHKLVWCKADNQCRLLSGAIPTNVRRTTVQALLNAGLVNGPLPVPKKDLGRYDADYNLSAAGRKEAREHKE